MRVVLVLVCWCVALVATRSLGYGAEETAALVSAIAALVSAARSTAGDPGVRAVPSA